MAQLVELRHLVGAYDENTGLNFSMHGIRGQIELSQPCHGAMLYFPHRVEMGAAQRRSPSGRVSVPS